MKSGLPGCLLWSPMSSRRAGRVEVELLSFLQRVLPKLSVNTFSPAFVLERAPCGSSHSQIPRVIEVGFMRAALIPFLLNGLWGFSLTLLGNVWKLFEDDGVRLLD